MKKEDIITVPNSSLRTKAKEIKIINQKVHSIVDDMVSATLDWENSRKHEVGVALAAVQINQLVNIVIVRDNYEDKTDLKFNVYINPKILKKYGDLVEDYEGCLSVPDIYGKVPRFSKLKIKYLDISGVEHQKTFSDFYARIMQHEIDHSEGTLFIDKIKDREDAFYILDKNGKLKPLNYVKDIKKNTILWK
ncbi:MAG: peptide deformylase [Patescibacteria group bacterium]|jgi:peptide deformylase|nr:peptide deformylase [Patescibacteria group bacterium]